MAVGHGSWEDIEEMAETKVHESTRVVIINLDGHGWSKVLIVLSGLACSRMPQCQTNIYEPAVLVILSQNAEQCNARVAARSVLTVSHSSCQRNAETKMNAAVYAFESAKGVNIAIVE